jgi:hypothetical protein
MTYSRMARASTVFLRFMIALVGAAVLAACIFALPEMWKGGSEEYPSASYALLLIMIGLYATAIPFFIGSWQAFRLLRSVDRGAAFSDASARALRIIRNCAIVIAVLYVGGIPLLFPIADADDAPGIVVMGMIAACAPITVAAVAAVLHRTLRQARQRGPVFEEYA